jgi:hypothetical protein
MNLKVKTIHDFPSNVMSSISDSPTQSERFNIRFEVQGAGYKDYGLLGCDAV